MKLSIIVPCYNEEFRLKNSIKRIADYLVKNNNGTELIFVNDGSLDNTEQELKNAQDFIEKRSGIKPRIFSYEQNRGKGYAVKTGLLHSMGKYVLICDADLSTPLSETDNLMKFIDDYDLVIGSRKQKDSRIVRPQHPIRKTLGKLFSQMSKLILNIPVNDFTCGFKLMTKKTSLQFAKRMTIDRWAYDSEILTIAAVRKLRIKEVGITWQNDFRTKVVLSRDVFSSFRDLLTIKFNAIMGKYD